MKITRITVYQVDLPFDRGAYQLSGGRSWEALDSTIIKIDTDEGIIGWGETCPFGPNYLEAFALGARAGIEHLAPKLLGRDPSQPAVIYALMDHYLNGHPYVKHGIDMACWDILGKLTRQPLYTLFGGIRCEYPASAGSVPSEFDDLLLEKIAQHRTTGCKQFSTKLSGDPDADIEFIQQMGKVLRRGETVKFDVNGGWRLDQALRVMAATANIDAYYEQPCASYEECRALHRACSRPLVLDECVLDFDVLVRGWHDGICEAVNLKLGKVGGLTPALQIRDLCTELGIPMYVQCSGGSNITQAAIVHLAHSTAADRLLYIWDIADLVSHNTVTNPIPRKDGKMHAHQLPGLGVEPIESVLGDASAVYG